MPAFRTAAGEMEDGANWQERAEQFLRTKGVEWLPWALVAIGTILRFRQYFFDRSLWLDEAFLALDITHDSFGQFGKLLKYGQVPPIGFAAAEKSVVGVLGNSEYALRLVPLLAGVAALFLFYLVARKTLQSRGVPIALGLFALSGPLVYYSSETKPYSVDVLVAVALYAIALPMDDLNWNRARAIWVGVAGALAIWFSYPSVFILSGIGLTLVFISVARKQWSALRSLLIPFVLWATSFGVCYAMLLRHEVNDSELLSYWRTAFMPFPPLSFRDVSWYTDNLFGVFAFPAGIAATGLAVALFSIGIGSFFHRRKGGLFFLVTPIVLTLAASAIHKYPFGERLILFLAPALILLVAEGASYLMSRCSSSLVQIAILAALFFVPAFSGLHHLIQPETREEIRPAINYIRAHQETGDLLYLYSPSYFAFRYYDERNKLAGITVVHGQSVTDDWGKDAADLSRLRGHRRVWILFSHVRTEGGMNEESLFLHLLDGLGTQRASFKAPGAAAYLYDLR